MKKNILFVVAMSKDMPLGGETRVGWELAEAFSKYTDNNVAILYGDTEEKAFSYFVDKQGITHIVLPVFSLTKLLYVGSVGLKEYIFVDRILKRFHPDIIHAHSISAQSILIQFWASMKSVPFVFTSHMIISKASDFLLPTDGWKRVLGEFATKTGVSFLYEFFNACNGVITLNKSGFDDIRSLNLDPRIRVFQIPNGRNFDSLLKLQRKFNPTHQINLIFVGTIGARKNQLFLLDVLQNLPSQFHLTLVGKFSDELFAKKFKKRLKELHLDNRVSISGYVPYKEVANYLKRAHFFVSASKREVQSLAVLEALGSGLPVIGLSNETIDEFEDGKTVIRLDKEVSAKQFADSVLGFISGISSEEYKHISSLAKQRIMHLDWRNVVNRTEKEVYDVFLSSDFVIEEVGFSARASKIFSLLKRKFIDGDKPYVKPRWWVFVSIVTFLFSFFVVVAKMKNRRHP